MKFTDTAYGFTDWDYLVGTFTYEEAYLRIVPADTEVSTISYSPSAAAPANGVFAVASAKRVQTNYPKGYILAMATADGGRDLVCQEAGKSGLKIASIASAGALDVGTYGYKIASSSQNGVNSGWSPVLANQTLKTVSMPSGQTVIDEAINTHFGARLDVTVAACSSYSQTFVYTVVGGV
jgi:hypothetical protein